MTLQVQPFTITMTDAEYAGLNGGIFASGATTGGATSGTNIAGTAATSNLNINGLIIPTGTTIPKFHPGSIWKGVNEVMGGLGNQLIDGSAILTATSASGTTTVGIAAGKTNDHAIHELLDRVRAVQQSASGKAYGSGATIAVTYLP